MRTVFFGSPQISVPFLESLLKLAEVAGVVTQTDKPSQRGQTFHPPPVKVFSENKGLPVLQPGSLRDQDFLSRLSGWGPEAGIVVAYGRILPREVIQIFPKGLFNVHFSLLPALRGAAPIPWAIMNGESVTGVTVFRIAETLDTGNCVVRKEIGISEHDNAVTLEEKLVPLGILALEETLDRIKRGDLKETPQSGTPTYAPLIHKEDARIDWKMPAELIARKVRAFIRIGAFTTLPGGKTCKILRVTPLPSEDRGMSLESLPGTLCGIEKGRGFVIKCGMGALCVISVQLEGKKETDSWSFLQGHKLKLGDQLS